MTLRKFMIFMREYYKNRRLRVLDLETNDYEYPKIVLKGRVNDPEYSMKVIYKTTIPTNEFEKTLNDSKDTIERMAGCEDSCVFEDMN